MCKNNNNNNSNPYAFNHSKENKFEALGASPGFTPDLAAVKDFMWQMAQTKCSSEVSELLVQKILGGDYAILSLITFLVMKGLMPSIDDLRGLREQLKEDVAVKDEEKEIKNTPFILNMTGKGLTTIH